MYIRHRYYIKARASPETDNFPDNDHFRHQKKVANLKYWNNGATDLKNQNQLMSRKVNTKAKEKMPRCITHESVKI